MQGPKERETREDYIKKAEVVCIVFDLTRESTLDSIIDYWIPYEIGRASCRERVLMPV